jgi:hypothetical protein
MTVHIVFHRCRLLVLSVPEPFGFFQRHRARTASLMLVSKIHRSCHTDCRWGRVQVGNSTVGFVITTRGHAHSRPMHRLTAAGGGAGDNTDAVSVGRLWHQLAVRGGANAPPCH